MQGNDGEKQRNDGEERHRRMTEGRRGKQPEEERGARESGHGPRGHGPRTHGRRNGR